jgi:ABC-type sugar transport system ATPase subunit
MDEIIELCDLVSILRDGKIVFEVSRNEFKVDELISQMIGRDLGDLYPVQQEVSEDAPVVLKVVDLVIENPRKVGEPLLKPFSFELRKGEILGIGGLVGSGRTEILKSLFGHYKIMGGEVQVNGNQIKSRSVTDSISHGFGYITEDRKAEGLFFNLAIKQNFTASIIETLTKLSLLQKTVEKSRARVYLERLQVKPQNLDVPISSLSGGNQQKVVLGKSLITGPKILMLDEPTKGVDIASKAEIYKTISEYAKDGYSVILISSEFPELLALSHRVIVFSGGRNVGEISGGLENEKKLMLMAIGTTEKASN